MAWIEVDITDIDIDIDKIAEEVIRGLDIKREVERLLRENSSCSRQECVERLLRECSSRLSQERIKRLLREHGVFTRSRSKSSA